MTSQFRGGRLVHCMRTMNLHLIILDIWSSYNRETHGVIVECVIQSAWMFGSDTVVRVNTYCVVSRDLLSASSCRHVTGAAVHSFQSIEKSRRIHFQLKLRGSVGESWNKASVAVPSDSSPSLCVCPEGDTFMIIFKLSSVCQTNRTLQWQRPRVFQLFFWHKRLIDIFLHFFLYLNKTNALRAPESQTNSIVSLQKKKIINYEIDFFVFQSSLVDLELVSGTSGFVERCGLRRVISF